MSWETLGVKKLNKIQDQPINLTGWSSGQVGVPMKALQDAGYLRALEIEVPKLTLAGTLGTGTLALQASAQLGVLRAINRFRLTTQAISSLVDIRGEDFFFLRYTSSRKGEYRGLDANYSFGSPPSAANGGVSLAGVNTSQSYSSPNGTLTLSLYLPMTIDVLLKNISTPVQLPDGKTASAIMDKRLEVSLINLQNAELAVQPSLLLNPAYSLTTDSPLLATGNATATGTFAGNVNSYIYDVPAPAADRPTPYQLSMILSRQNVDTTVNGSTAEVDFRRAGLLLKAHYVAYDSNDNLVDWAATPGATLEFAWGTKVSKRYETVESNIAECIRRYGAVPPQGLLVHDFFTDTETLDDTINTVRLANVRCLFTGLSGISKIRCIEERLIPVRLRSAA